MYFLCTVPAIFRRLSSESLCKGSSVPSVRIPMVLEESMRPGDDF